MKLWHLVLVAALLIPAASASPADYFLYAGTGGESRGIYGYRFDSHNGRTKPLGLLAGVSDTSFLLEHPDHRFLYAASKDAGSVSAFLIALKTGKLTPVNRSSTKGSGPCHLALDRSGRWLAAANCAGGSFALFPLRKDGGLGDARLIMLPSSPDSRVTCVLFSPDNRYLLVADQGLDKIVEYDFDPETGSLGHRETQFLTASPGVGIRQLIFHPSGRAIYAANGTRHGVTTYRWNAANGALDEVQTLTLPQLPGSSTENSPEIAANAAGSIVYASFGSDELGLLTVDPQRLTLSVLESTPLVGRKPSHFTLDPTGGYLAVANLDSNDISIYSVHPHTGQLRPVSRVPSIDRPSSLAFVPIP